MDIFLPHSPQAPPAQLQAEASCRLSQHPADEAHHDRLECVNMTEVIEVGDILTPKVRCLLRPNYVQWHSDYKASARAMHV